MIKHLPLLLFIGLAYWGCDSNEGCIDESNTSDTPLVFQITIE